MKTGKEIIDDLKNFESEISKKLFICDLITEICGTINLKSQFEDRNKITACMVLINHIKDDSDAIYGEAIMAAREAVNQSENISSNDLIRIYAEQSKVSILSNEYCSKLGHASDVFNTSILTFEEFYLKKKA